MILGIDEVGRGPWAGPLVVGAVVLGGVIIEGLTDSKKLSRKRREELNVIIRQKASGFGLGWVSATEIDEIGLSAALKLATIRAVNDIKTFYDEIIIDGTVNFLTDTNKGQYVTTLKKADLLIPSVSAASIIAKVARDAYMAEQDAMYAGYGFKSHVGYGTAAHVRAIEKLGVTPLHRLSFAPLQKYTASRSASDSSATSTDLSRNSNSISFPQSSRSHFPQEETKSEVQPKSFPERESEELLGRNGLFAGGARKGDVGINDQKGEKNDRRTTKQIGDAAETEVANYLIRHGHKIIDRNWKTKYCEIDIISTHRGTIYFTEVKYRKTPQQGGGLAAITPRKLRQMKFAVELYVLKNELHDSDLQLAVASVSDTPPEVEDFLKI